MTPLSYVSEHTAETQKAAKAQRREQEFSLRLCGIPRFCGVMARRRALS